jgi:ABC-type uncharacterized transport system involved in gliding motility auxiliary subunit
MSRPPGFAAARWWRTLHLLLQGVLIIGLFAGFNYLALHHSWRHDLTSHRHHSLSPETLSYLQNLRQPVRVVVTLDPDDDNAEVRAAHRDVMSLLREYRHATAARPEGRITVTELNVFQQRREAELLGIDRANTLLVLCGDRRRVIGLDELYVVANRTRQAFRGEQALTAAILDVANPARHRVWFLAGHGEMSPDDVDPLRGLSLLADELRLRNFAVGTLDLTQNRAIPEEAELLVIAAPQGPFNAFEVEQLRRHLSTRAGRLLILLPPGVPHGLDDLLYDWGVLADDVWVVDHDPQSITEGGDLRIRAFGAHPITQTLIDYRIPLTLGPTRVARADPGRALDDGLRVTVLAATSETAWGERDYLQRRVPEYNPGIDLRGLPDAAGERRLGVIVASERVTPPAELPFSVRGGKLVLIGNADLIANHRLSSPGHLNLFLNAVNWAIDRDTRLNTPPRQLQRYRITLSQTEAARLRISLLLVLPGLAALLGLIVYWVRRT